MPESYNKAQIEGAKGNSYLQYDKTKTTFKQIWVRREPIDLFGASSHDCLTLRRKCIKSWKVELTVTKVKLNIYFNKIDMMI